VEDSNPPLPPTPLHKGGGNERFEPALRYPLRRDNEPSTRKGEIKEDAINIISPSLVEGD